MKIVWILAIAGLIAMGSIIGYLISTNYDYCDGLLTKNEMMGRTVSLSILLVGVGWFFANILMKKSDNDGN